MPPDSSGLFHNAMKAIERLQKEVDTLRAPKPKLTRIEQIQLIQRLFKGVLHGELELSALEESHNRIEITVHPKGLDRNETR